MAGLAGRPGSWGGLVLRVGQTFFAAACIGVMCSSLGFASYTAFCYLIASMGLQMLWSFGLACLDGYAITANKDLTSPILLSLFVVGDWLGVRIRGKIISVYCMQSGVGLLFIKVTAILSFAASCSAAGVVILFQKDVLFCRRYPQLPCGKFELATVFAFLSWALSATSALIMFWLLAAF